MNATERLTDLLNRVGSYAPWEVVIELVLIWVVVFAIIRFIQGTRAARANPTSGSGPATNRTEGQPSDSSCLVF